MNRVSAFLVAASLIVGTAYHVQAEAKPKPKSESRATKNNPPPKAEVAKRVQHPSPPPNPSDDSWTLKALKITSLEILDDGSVAELSGAEMVLPSKEPNGRTLSVRLVACSTRGLLQLSKHPELLFAIEHDSLITIARGVLRTPIPSTDPGTSSGVKFEMCVDKLWL